MKHVYLVRAGDSQYKVGIASNIYNRVRALQTSNGHQIQLITSRPTPNAAEVERQIHKLLEEKRLNGGKEWFNLTPERALDLAVQINLTPSLDISELEELHKIIAEQTKAQNRIHRKLENLLSQVKADPYQRIVDAIMVDDPVASKNPATITPRKNDDEYKKRAVEIFVAEGRVSTSLLQRKLSIGYGRAARIIDELEKEGKITPFNGSEARQLIVPPEPLYTL